MRQIAPELWAGLGSRERRRFLRTTAAGEVVGADGRVVQGLYYIGPWLRARDWETTAVPELRGHAQRLAERLAGTALQGRQRQDRGSDRWRRALGVAAAGAARY